MKSPALKAIYQLIFGAGPDRVTKISSPQELPSSNIVYMKRVNAWRAIILCIYRSVTIGGIFILVCYILSSSSVRADSFALTVTLAIVFAFISLAFGLQAWGLYQWFNFQDSIGPEVPDPKDWPGGA